MDYQGESEGKHRPENISKTAQEGGLIARGRLERVLGGSKTGSMFAHFLEPILDNF